MLIVTLLTATVLLLTIIMAPLQQIGCVLKLGGWRRRGGFQEADIIAFKQSLLLNVVTPKPRCSCQQFLKEFHHRDMEALLRARPGAWGHFCYLKCILLIILLYLSRILNAGLFSTYEHSDATLKYLLFL